ncbi:MAG: hypothetical protein EBV03_05160 [Proteobacteria bacterium]|nr:hypothetical protein [Pseudomonadota bacterium]
MSPPQTPFERVDSIEHLIEDLRRNNPRLLLIIGERHDSIETRKLFKRLGKGADVGFFESSNLTGSPTGEEDDRAHRQQQLAKAKAGGEAMDIVRNETMLVPNKAVFVDEKDTGEDSIRLSQAAVRRMEKDNATHSKQYEWVKTIHHDRILNRLESSNPVIANTIANHLDTHFPGNTPFFATLLIGNGHFRDLDKLGLEGTNSDLLQGLRKRGYRPVTIDVEPEPRIQPKDAPGKHFIIPEYIKNGVDFSLHVIDPGARHAQRRR